MSRLSGAFVAAAAAAIGLLTAIGALPHAGAQPPYAPRTVAAFEVCRKEALAAHPGEVVRVSTRTTQTLFHIRVTIAQKDEKEVIVICDGTSGQVLRVVQVDE